MILARRQQNETLCTNAPIISAHSLGAIFGVQAFSLGLTLSNTSVRTSTCDSNALTLNMVYTQPAKRSCLANAPSSPILVLRLAIACLVAVACQACMTSTNAILAQCEI